MIKMTKTTHDVANYLLAAQEHIVVNPSDF